jgi:hypothetical protein
MVAGMRVKELCITIIMLCVGLFVFYVRMYLYVIRALVRARVCVCVFVW